MPVLALVLAFLVSFVLAGLVTLLLDDQPSSYDRAVQRRLNRHGELVDSYWQFVGESGRAPTTHELWDLSPPPQSETE